MIQVPQFALTTDALAHSKPIDTLVCSSLHPSATLISRMYVVTAIFAFLKCLRYNNPVIQ